jgi:hypothetical protein
MTNDSTNFCIQKKQFARKGNLFGFGSHKYKYVGKSLLHYKLGVDIYAGSLVWVEGPYPAGVCPDVKLFNIVLSHCLKPD